MKLRSTLLGIMTVVTLATPGFAQDAQKSTSAQPHNSQLPHPPHQVSLQPGKSGSTVLQTSIMNLDTVDSLVSEVRSQRGSLNLVIRKSH